MSKLPYRQSTFGNQNDWAGKKMKAIITNPEGTLTLKSFDDEPKRMAVVISCFPKVLSKASANVLKTLHKIAKRHGECPKNENFWSWYVEARKTRVATMQTDFRVMYQHLQIAGYYSRTYKQMFLNYRLNHRDGVHKGEVVLTEDEIAYVIRKEYNLSTGENRLKQKALDIFVLSLFTGARVADVRNIIRSTDEFGNPVLLYHNHKGTRTQSIAWNKAVDGPLQRGYYKTQGKNIALYAALKAALYEALPSTSNRLVSYYFLRPGQGRELKSDSRISHMTFHSARHTFCTRLLRKGVSPSIVAQLAGHRSLNTTMRYYNWTRATEANDVLRTIYGDKSLAGEKPNWGEGAGDTPLSLNVHEAQVIKGKDGALLSDDGGIMTKFQASRIVNKPAVPVKRVRKGVRKSKPSAKALAWQEKMKRLGVS